MGGGTAGLNSLDYTINLGGNPLDDAPVANRLSLSAEVPSPQLATPAGLRVNYMNTAGNETLFAQDLSPRQVLSPQALADFITLSPYRYQIRLYTAANKGAKDAGTGLYVPTGAPFKVVTIENPDQSPTVYNRLHIVETPDQGSASGQDYLYTFTGGSNRAGLNNQWELVSQNGQRHETLLSVPNGSSDRTETRTVQDAAGKVVSCVRRWYHTFTWGEEIVAECVDPDGAALTTAYDYWHVDVPDPANPPPDPYRYWANHLKRKVEPNGHWERYEYDNLDRPTKHVVQFLDAPQDAPDNQCRATTTSYDDSVPAKETEVETLQGVEVSRRYRRYLGGGKAQEIVCQHPGAAIDAADNLVTTTVTDQLGNVLSTQRPDGTLSLFSQSVNGGQKTTVTTTGAPNVDGTAVADGTRTTTVTDSGGHQLLQTVEDVASGLTLSSATTSQTDGLGRPTRVDYTDGSFELTGYDCCGVASRTDRDGVSTTYTYDALRHLASESRAGVTTRYTDDPTGQRLSTVREGSDGSRITTEKLAYDVAGRQTSRTDALGRVTLFTEAIDPATGHTARTTTYADGSTRVETVFQDGSLLSVGGTAAHPLLYAYGADAAAGEWRQEIRVGDGGAASEWTMSFTDVAGRAYRTLSAAGAVTQSFFNARGQTVRAVDADGVATLFGYNARGEQEVVALDLDGNGQIDFAGTDRLTRTTQTVLAAHGTVVARTSVSAWTLDGQDTPAVLSVDERSADGRSAWHTDAGGVTTSSVTACDGAGTCTTTLTLPDGSSTVGVVAQGLALSQTRRDANGLVLSATTLDYDAQGRLWHQTDRRDGPTEFLYDDADQLRRVSHQGQVTGYGYDERGRKRLQTEPDGGQVQTLYFPTGEVRSVGGARTYPQAYTYDAQGRLRTLTTRGAAGEAVTTWHYDAQSGRMIFKEYADGRGPTYTYTPAGRLHTRTWARGIVTTYGYEGGGQLGSITYSDGVTAPAAYTYDRLGRLATASGGGSARSLSYQGNTSLLASEGYTVGPLAGVSVNTGYDGLLRRAGLEVRQGASTLVSQSFGFDAASRLKTASQGAASATYTYHADSAANLVDTITFSNTDGSGHAQPVMTTTKKYDLLDRLTRTTSTLAGATVPVSGYGYAYNDANQRTRADVIPDGSHWLYGYDGLGQVTGASRRWNSDDTLVAGQQYGYSYDSIGNRTSTVTNGRQSRYTPNKLNQYEGRTVPGAVDVLGQANPSATVTLNGQPTTRQEGGYFAGTATADNTQAAQDVPVDVVAAQASSGAGSTNTLAEQQGKVFLPQTPEQFSYDADGNMTWDGRWTYNWDAENRLIGMEALSNSLATGRKKLKFCYDDLGRRQEKQLWNWNMVSNTWQVEAKKLFAHDDWSLVAELSGVGNTVPMHTCMWGLDLSGSLRRADGVNGLLISTEYTNDEEGTTKEQASLVCCDGNGSVVALIDTTCKHVDAQYEYGPFGEFVRLSGKGAQSNYIRFFTKFFDSETDLTYYEHRYYSPRLGRWSSVDRIGHKGGLNLHAFVANDPINYIDTYGFGTWRFGVDNSGQNANHPGGQPTVDVAYILGDAERRCCTACRVDRYVKDVLKKGGAAGSVWAPDDDDILGGGTAPTNGPVRADLDVPNGVGTYFLASSYTYKFKWIAICTAGPLKDKTLSMIERTYHTESHIGVPYSGYFVDAPHNALYFY